MNDDGLPSAADGAVIDDEWEAMVREYAAAMPVRIDALAAALGEARAGATPESLATPTTLAHRLFGTAGSYGFTAISDAASALEEELVAAAARGDRPDDAWWDRVSAMVAHLQELARVAAADG